MTATARVRRGARRGRWTSAAIRADFPILARTVRDGKPLVYLDSGATSQKPRQVLDAERGVLRAAQRRRAPRRAPARRGGDRRLRGRPRDASRAFIGAPDRRGRLHQERHRGAQPRRLRAVQRRDGDGARAPRGSPLGPGDEIVVTEMEHHANLVPWQELCRAHRRDAALVRPSPTTAGSTCPTSTSWSPSAPRSSRSPTQSNVLGTVNPVARARRRGPSAVGALAVLDACQSVPHLPVDVAALGVDFLAFSGHKMLGPTGIGVLWGRYELLDAHAAVPHRRLDDRDVAHGAARPTPPPPQRFEAGVPMTAQAVGLGAAVDYLQRARHGPVAAHEHALTGYALDAARRASRASASSARPTPATAAARSRSSSTASTRTTSARCSTTAASPSGSGHHCAWPLHRRFGVPATTRATFYAATTPLRRDRRAGRRRSTRPSEFFGVA